MTEENKIVPGEIYNFTSRTYNSPTASLYIGKRRPYKEWPGKHIIVYRLFDEVKALAFNAFEVKDKDLRIKRAQKLSLSKLEQDALNYRLKAVNL